MKENTLAQFGIIGLGVMGSNIALNVENKGFSVSVYNYTEDLTNIFINKYSEKNFIFTSSLQEFVNSLEKPRKILLMIKAGKPTDDTIDRLIPFLDKDDIVIDGGNTNFKDTIKRNNKLKNSKINFIGMGVSGGEYGALHGPSLMPGGPKNAVDNIMPILKKIAAKAKDNVPCVSYIGPNGAGHYVKMIHNGIEYGDEELICESFNILQHINGLNTKDIANIFSSWNQGELNSYLIEITAQILTKHDDLGDSKTPIVDVILDKANNKGTGKWSSENALDIETPQSVITESVFARYISMLKDDRIKASKLISKEKQQKVQLKEKESFIESLRKALFFSKIISYAQGFNQMQTASQKYDWHLNLGQLAQIWRSGCIIRAQFLQKITDAFNKDKDLNNLLFDDYFLQITKNYNQAVRDIIIFAIQNEIPVPAFSAAISYYDSFKSEKLPANLLQAQRDLFGAHTFERTDRPGHFHYQWGNND